MQGQSNESWKALCGLALLEEDPKVLSALVEQVEESLNHQRTSGSFSSNATTRLTVVLK